MDSRTSRGQTLVEVLVILLFFVALFNPAVSCHHGIQPDTLGSAAMVKFGTNSKNIRPKIMARILLLKMRLCCDFDKIFIINY